MDEKITWQYITEDYWFSVFSLDELLGLKTHSQPHKFIPTQEQMDSVAPLGIGSRARDYCWNRYPLDPMKKSVIKKLICIPLEFHHQDIHARLDSMESSITELKGLLLAILSSINEKEGSLLLKDE